MKIFSPAILTRRGLLLGGGAALGAVALPGIVRAEQTKVDWPVRCEGAYVSTRLAVPDFKALKILSGQNSSFISGLRPHRDSGVRLAKIERPRVGGKRKFLIHNYGHSGAGITLAFGCATRVRAMVETAISELKTEYGEKANLDIAILGCGVIGLTVAEELQRHHPALKKRIIARETDVEKTVSYMAGGQFEPSGAYEAYSNNMTELHELVRGSHRRILDLVKEKKAEKYGIVKRRNFALLRGRTQPLDLGMPRDVVASHQVVEIKFENFSRRMKEYCTWLINPTMLLPELKREIQSKMAIETDTIRSMKDIDMLPESIVINCTGLGAGGFVTDETCLRGIRGHLAILEQPRSRLDYFFSGGFPSIAYLFARQDDIVVGGTYCNEQDCKRQTTASCGEPKDRGPGLLKTIQRLFDDRSLI